MNTSKKKPQLFEYQDVLDFLKDTYKYNKQNIPGFSYEMWANELSLRSRSYLRAVILGSKPLQESLLPLFLKNLNFNNEEAAYFVLLYRIQIAPTPELKNIYLRELFSIWKVKLQETEVKDIAEFLSDPLIPVLFTYLSFDNSSSDMATIARDLNSEFNRIQNGLRCLIWNKLIDGSVQDDGQIVYKTTSPFFKVPSIPADQYLKKFHADGIQLAREAVDLLPASRKLFSSFLVLDDEQLKAVQTLIEDFNRRLLAVTESDSIKEKKIYRLNQQLFPVSEKVPGPELVADSTSEEGAQS